MMLVFVDGSVIGISGLVCMVLMLCCSDGLMLVLSYGVYMF